MAGVLYGVGGFAARHRFLVLVVWLAVAAGVGATISRIGDDTNDNLSLPGTDSQAATDLLASKFPPQQNGTSPIVFHVESGKVTDSKPKQAITDSFKAIEKEPHVYSATSPFGQGGSTLISKDGKTAFIPVLLDIGSNDLTTPDAQAILDAAQPAVAAGIQVAAGGPIGSELSKPETESSEVIGIVAAMIILALTFGALVAMGLPILTAIIGLALGLSLIGLLSHVAQVPSIASTVATMIGLGVGIDYALFMVTRHLHQLKDGVELRESIARTVGTSGSAIVFAGATVVIALLALSVARIPLVSALGYSAALAVFTAVLAAITLMPALLSIAGRHITSLRVPSFLRTRPKPPGKGFWAAWARFVTGKPWLAIALAIAILVPLVIPLFSLRLGQEDIGSTPKSTTERQAYDLMSAGFGPGYNGPLLIATELGTSAKASATVQSQENQLQSLQTQLQQEQKEGNQQQKQLQQEGNQLQQQQKSLEQQQSSLEAQQQQLLAKQSQLERQANALQVQKSQLDSQAAELRRQEAALRAEEASLEARARALVDEATRLVRKAATLGRQLVSVRAQERVVEAAIGQAQGPNRKQRLENRLAALQRREQRIEGELAAIRKQGPALRAEAVRLRSEAAAARQRADSLRAQAASLTTQAASLAAQASSLEKQKQSLESQGAALQKQADSLQQQGDALQKQADQLNQQKAQLQQLQNTAKQQQKQAEQLQDQLTTELTKAGGDDRGTDPRLVKLQDALTGTSGVQGVSPPQINKSGEAVIYSVIATTAPSDEATADLVETLRSTVIPQATAGSDVQAFVGGSTASNVDLATEITSRLPLVIVVVIALSFIVLLLAFRSLLVPLQAAVTNLVTVGASFGVMTACFQWGWGTGLIGMDVAGGEVPIASYVPLMMFAVLFGLSMDYQVFLLSQIGLHRAEGEDDRTAARSGLEVAAKVIVAAALIMICVFGSFILNGDPIVKQFGVGLAVAVALAGTMVLLLAPALLVLMGRGTWWLPRWLGRILPHIDIEGEKLLADRGIGRPDPAA